MKDIKISIWPFVGLIIITGALIFGANTWNRARQLTKLDQLRAHSEAILAKHVSDFKEGNEKIVLENLNNDEGGVRQVYLLRSLDNGEMILFEFGYQDKRNLDKFQTEIIKNLIRTDTTTSIDGSKLTKVLSENDLYSFVPIANEKKFVGWLVVGMDKQRGF